MLYSTAVGVHNKYMYEVRHYLRPNYVCLEGASQAEEVRTQHQPFHPFGCFFSQSRSVADLARPWDKAHRTLSEAAPHSCFRDKSLEIRVKLSPKHEVHFFYSPDQVGSRHAHPPGSSSANYGLQREQRRV